MYSLDAHGRMIADRDRARAYFRALERRITPNTIVADIGTGCGIFALFAAKLGARRVYAMDDAEVINIAREIAEHNHLHHRIKFIQKRSTEVSLKHRADVIVSDLRGVLPLFGAHPADIIDARRRLLAPGGVLIPRADVVKAAPVEATSFYEALVDPWKRRKSGIDGKTCRRAAVNNWYRQHVQPAQLLAPADTWAVLDYAALDTSDVSGTCGWTVSRNGTLHGLAFWFDAELDDGIVYSNAPAETEKLYGSAFFPLESPVDVTAGDRVSFGAGAKKLSENYLWTWETTVFDTARNTRKARASQSTFYGAMLSLDELHRAATDARSSLGTRGRAMKTVLEGMADGETPEGIAAALANAFPREFPRPRNAARFIDRALREFAENP